MLKVNAHGGVLPRRRASSSRRDGVRGSGHLGGASAEQECGDLQLPSVGAREVMACAGARTCSLQRLPYPFEYEGNGGRPSFYRHPAGRRCGAFSLIPVLQEADEGAAADGLTPLLAWRQASPALHRARREEDPSGSFPSSPFLSAQIPEPLGLRTGRRRRVPSSSATASACLRQGCIPDPQALLVPKGRWRPLS
jgi:hypothetical protein